MLDAYEEKRMKNDRRYSTRFRKRLPILVRLLTVLFFVLSHVTSAVADSTEQQELVDKARITTDSLLVDPDFPGSVSTSKRPRLCSSCRNC